MSQQFAFFTQEGDFQFSLPEKPQSKRAAPKEQLSNRKLPKKLAEKLQDKKKRAASQKKRYFAHLAGETGEMPSLKKLEQDPHLRSSFQSKTLSRKGGQ